MIPLIQRRASWFVLLCLVAFCMACGASSRTKTLRVNLVALNKARDAVLAISKEREKQLYDSCLDEIKRVPPTCSQEEGHVRVDAWQKKVDEVINVIDIGYRAQHDAALLDDTKSAAAAAAAAAKALDLYKQLKEKP